MYLISVGLQYCWGQLAFYLKMTFLSMFIEFCILFESLAVDIKQCLKIFNGNVISKRFSRCNRIEVIKTLGEVVQFHSDAKELRRYFQINLSCFKMCDIYIFFVRFTDRFFDAFNIILSIVFMISSTWICASVLYIDYVCLRFC